MEEFLFNSKIFCYTGVVESHTKQLSKLLLVDLLGSFLWFPLWWYTTGLEKVARYFWQSLLYRSSSYGLRIWIRNFFVPMYGQSDIQGKVVSVFMRLIVLVGRSLALAFEAAIYVLGLCLWIVAPAFFLLMFVLGLAKGALPHPVSISLY